ncbi:hypothetical protein AOQ84DRAFT_381322 [Glonium stellatum]|uniref:RING-type domain-containing protein n=1 Tax=Glonium stellatum TaxID=574774 RepID=A0A8E2ESE0_9PEZI|nr:hypothetical protein AOQ84DRAFT_381322 [Glonium stellatum]
MALLIPKWLALSLILAVASAQILPSNTSSHLPSTGSFELLASKWMSNVADVVPLTNKAAGGSMPPPGITGTLFLATPTTISNLTSKNIAYISCDPSDYPGNIDALAVLQRAVGVNATASLLYSRTSSSCNYTAAAGNLQDFLLYSMNSADDSNKLLDDLVQTPNSEAYFVTISHNTTDTSSSNGSTSNSNNSNNANPLGPSPSTAVAMIILYSITGIITALFLIIIVTGAIRAHRHPDRYGPRDVLGRPRQSRARGLARAMLDTLPIVKFGEREPPKPADVELGSSSEARNVVAATGTEDIAGERSHLDQEHADVSSAQPASAPQESVGDHTGIAPAEPLPAAAAGAHDSSSPDEGLGCSICTDDFERGQDIRVLPCNHKFHPACVDPWLLNVSGTCPLCRIDLRPTTSHSSTNEDNGNDDRGSLAPPLGPADPDSSYRRRSALRDILSLRSRPNATTEERLAALRRLREHRAQSGDVAGPESSTGGEEPADPGRRKRVSVMLQDVFSIRTRRTGAEGGNARGSSSVISSGANGAGGSSSSVERSDHENRAANGEGDDRSEEQGPRTRDPSPGPTR